MDFDGTAYLNKLRRTSLDELLAQLEVDLSRNGQGRLTDPRELLYKLDEVHRRLYGDAASESKYKAEIAQFDYLVTQFEKHAQDMLNDLGGSDRLAVLRADRQPQSGWRWWAIDETLRKQKKASLRRAMVTVGGILLSVILFIVLYQTILRPDPAVSATYSLKMNAEKWLYQGQFLKALEELDRAIALSPQNGDLYALRGAVRHHLGDLSGEAADFDLAQNIVGDREKFSLLKIQAWMTTGELAAAKNDAQKLLLENPQSAEGYFYLGRASEMLQEFRAALSAYETASTLAQAQGKLELNASIRVAYAMLMQAMPGLMPTETRPAGL